VGSFTKGEIVLFPFPYTDLKGSKLRPCLVLSEEMREDILLCQITSQRIPKDEYCISLLKNETKNGSLKIDSFIRANMLFTASKNMCEDKLCKIETKKYSDVVLMINKIISK